MRSNGMHARDKLRCHAPVSGIAKCPRPSLNYGVVLLFFLTVRQTVAESKPSNRSNNSLAGQNLPDAGVARGDVGSLAPAALAVDLREEPHFPLPAATTASRGERRRRGAPTPARNASSARSLAESPADCQPHLAQALEQAPARRLLMAVSSPQNVSEGHVGNIVATALDLTRVVLAFQDYARGRRGMLLTCQAPGGTLACSQPQPFTSGPVHSAVGSLAVVAVADNRVVLAWKQGGTPYLGHVRVCMADLSQCGGALVVRAEWAAVAVAAFLSGSFAFAYVDRRKGHHGTIHVCDVAGLVLMCDAGRVFEPEPMASLSMLALSDASLSYQDTSGNLVLAYEVHGPRASRFGRLQPCVASGNSLSCDPKAAVRFTDGPIDGSSLVSLSSRLFVVGYADRQTVCPRPTSQRRRRELHVCTLVDGHPSIGRARLCRAVFAGMGIVRPELECGEPIVIDDGYETQRPVMARQNDTAFAAAYGCSGCGDLGSRGLFRHCQAPLSALYGDLGTPLGNLTCGSTLTLNNATTQWVVLAAGGGGFVTAYHDYGGQGDGSVRFVS
mmetsp:Transcript_27191/g.54939  ORF Transcript_27191/g.54939 Transcript_27191/m.54939 type:complete len:557 (+) Transcript_27191:87-1757(+)